MKTSITTIPNGLSVERLRAYYSDEFSQNNFMVISEAAGSGYSFMDIRCCCNCCCC